jgi:hypothetical protein
MRPHRAGFAFLETAMTEPEQQPALVENMLLLRNEDFGECSTAQQNVVLNAASRILD